MTRYCFSRVAMYLLVLLLSFETHRWIEAGHSGTVMAAESIAEKGLQSGDPLGAFRVIKVAGASQDTVEPGDTLCYRCRYGSSPMVLVFVRRAPDNLDELVKQLDQAIAENADSKLKALVTFIGDEIPKLKDDAARLAERVGETALPIVVAEDSQTGPLEYQIDESAAVTVIIAQDSQVFATETSPSDASAGDSVSGAKIAEHINAMLSESE